ncbi:Glu/Leu/Phe/Val dehydrogenase [Micromonospora sp. NPDC005686]|uniref:Glu/Leu/Phe/Val family dehydrogenase n=2 Tax=Micromonospora TaxID=1873 RepID=UPI0033ADABF1
MMQETAAWPTDDLGPAAVHFFELTAGATGIVVLDNLVLGPAIGGVRMTPTVTVGEVARLARAMTIKNAVAGLPHGGGKSGIRINGPLDPAARQSVLRSFARAIRHVVDYIPGPDVGTDETAMAWIRDEIGRAVGLPGALGGIPLNEVGATGYGVAKCAEALHAANRLELAGARVAVQGFGAVGRVAALELARLGARVVAVSDITGAVYDQDGLDVDALAAFQRTGPIAEYHDVKRMERDQLLTVECDILIPAAQGDAVHMGNVDDVRARTILQGANLPVTPEAEAVLARRGVLSVPDVIVNAGGVICAAAEHRGRTRAEAFTEIADRITANTLELLDRVAARPGLLPADAAVEMAQTRLDVARAYQRTF